MVKPEREIRNESSSFTGGKRNREDNVVNNTTSSAVTRGNAQYSTWGANISKISAPG